MRATFMLLALAAAGCASTTPGDNAPKLAVDFNWDNVRPCSNESPPIKVFNAPAGTTRLKIELADIDAMFSNRSGSEVEYKGSPNVPAGALRDYRGPCPQGGKPVAVRYELRVSALDAKGAVIGYGTAIQAYTPPKIVPGARL
jgi:hypothetical protein